MSQVVADIMAKAITGALGIRSNSAVDGLTKPEQEKKNKGQS